MFLEALEALKRLHRAADQAVRRAVVWAPLAAALLGGAPYARASSPAYLNINVNIQGIGGITDLTAVQGASTGTVGLSWTEPYRTAGSAPYSYDVRASTVGQIATDTVFSTSPLLAVFSPSVPPVPGTGGGAAGFVVAGLTGNVTYYFAIREKDSTTFHGSWLRTTAPPRNVNNFAVPVASTTAPGGGLVTGVSTTTITAAWNVSAGATDYVLAASTGAANPPTLVSASSTTLSSTATVSGLAPNTTYFLLVSACGAGCSSYTPLGSTITLAAPAITLSTTSVSSTTVALTWSPNGNPSGTNYLVEASTDGVAYANVQTSTVAAGSVVGLTGGGTYYFEVVALNGAGIAAAPSNVLLVHMPNGPTPSTPTGLTASGGLLSVSLSWTALPPLQQGLGLAEYRLLRSLNAGFGFVQVATAAGTSFQDKPLSANVTYYYEIVARDIGGTDSAPSAPVAALPFTVRPMEPLGITAVPSSTTVTLAWSPTTRFFDGTPFVTTGAPNGDELQGYSIYRSTNICDPSYVQISSLSITSTSLTDYTNGLNYYYRVFSFNTLGYSSNVITISSLGEFNYFMDDCVTDLVLDAGTAATLNGATNGLGDIRMTRNRRPQDVGSGIFQSGEWEAYLNGSTLLKNYVLAKPGRYVLHFSESGGVPVPSTGPSNGFAPLAVPAAVPAVGVGDLGMYWYNGLQFMKMYGKIDPVGQTVTVDSPNTGIYQIRAQARAAGAVFDLSNLSSRVITPNGDGLNDTLIFTYDPGPHNVTPAGKIFDLRGAAVADMTPGLVPNTLTWNGYMNGLPVHSGAYVYRITGDGKTFTGTIVVAR
jgi:fibronectin type 3 domain-containing protein